MSREHSIVRNVEVPHWRDDPAWGRYQRRSLTAGAVALLVCVAGAILSPAHLFRAYLVAYQFWLGIALGCLVVVMVHNLTGGAWGIVLRGPLEAATRTLLLLAFLFLPLVLGLHDLYPWTHESVGHKALYLNVPFFLIRAAVYFTVWLGLAYLLSRWSRRPTRRLQLLSAWGLVLYGLTITFASVDWGMSLEPEWYSSMYPVLFATGQMLGGLAFAVGTVMLLARRQHRDDSVPPDHLRDLGSLLLAFVMLWAYMSISQYLLIWMANLPEETLWYLRRTRNGWQWVALTLVVFQFALPFLLLLSSSVKRDMRALGAVTLLILVMRYVDLLWWIEPAFPQTMRFFVFLDLAALVGLGGLWIWWFLRELQKQPMLLAAQDRLGQNQVKRST